MVWADAERTDLHAYLNGSVTSQRYRHAIPTPYVVTYAGALDFILKHTKLESYMHSLMTNASSGCIGQHSVRTSIL